MPRFQEDFVVLFLPQLQKAGPGVVEVEGKKKRQNQKYNLILLPELSIDKLAGSGVGWDGNLNTQLRSCSFILCRNFGIPRSRLARINSRASGSKHDDDLPVKLSSTSPSKESTFSVTVRGRQDEQPFWLISGCLLWLASSLFPPNKECKLILRLSPALGFLHALGSGLLR